MAPIQFTFASPSRLVFGPGRFTDLPGLALPLGRTILFLTGRASLQKTTAWDRISQEFSARGARLSWAAIPAEPSPDLVDAIVRENRDTGIEVVVAAGGGSVLDAGKAVAAMMGREESVTTYLEGVGTRTHDGKTLPFIAVPTTSGTGSEATKNAVLSTPGASGFKKSLRHDNFVPDLALVDPELTLSCPRRVTAACGMDALTQLLEAYVSVKAGPMTDALCQSGLTGFGTALARVLTRDPKDIEARSRLSYGAYISGLALANAGLGVVHGFASVIGGLAANRHGEVCGTLLAETTRATIQALEERPGHPGLEKYARAAVWLGLADPVHPVEEACSRLVRTLFQWTEDYTMPRLSGCGIRKTDIPAIAAATGQKNTPAPLSRETLEEILQRRL